MKKQDLQNRRLDRIGDELLKAVRLRDEEIDTIVAAPNLFEAVKARIDVERSRREAKGFSVLWAYWQRAAVLGALAVLLIGAVSLIIFTRQDSSPDVAVEDPTQTNSTETLPQIPPNTTIPNPEIKNQAFAQRVVSKGKSKQALAKRQPLAEIEEIGEFYALTYVGDPEETVDDGQIVRVELPRSSLFAMGIDVPVENDAARIKTDLLIGSDGVMRAVRVVD